MRIAENIMKCENEFCIYQENNNCTNKNEIGIDWRGFCKNLVLIRMPKRDLDAGKLVTQASLKAGNHFFDKEIGKVVLTDETLEFYDAEINI